VEAGAQVVRAEAVVEGEEEVGKEEWRGN